MMSYRFAHLKFWEHGKQRLYQCPWALNKPEISRYIARLQHLRLGANQKFQTK